MYVHITAYSETKNVNKDTAAMLVSALGISNSIGRPVFGLLAKVPCCSSLILYATSFTFCGVVVLLIPLMRDFTGVLVLTCAFGFLSASIGPLLPQLITEFLSIDLIPSGYGYVLAFEAVGSLTGPPAAGMCVKPVYIFFMKLDTKLDTNNTIIKCCKSIEISHIRLLYY